MHWNEHRKMLLIVFFFFAFRGLKRTEVVLLTHGDSIDCVANGFRAIAKSGSLVAAIANESTKIYGLQFHPEVRLSGVD